MPDLKIVESLAYKHKIPLYFFCDTSHQIDSMYAKTMICDRGFQSADMILLSYIKEGDIVITYDYGLAAISLSKKAFVLHPNGFLYTNHNIDSLLLNRYIRVKNRKKEHRKGPHKRTEKERQNMIFFLERLIKEQNT